MNMPAVRYIAWRRHKDELWKRVGEGITRHGTWLSALRVHQRDSIPGGENRVLRVGCHPEDKPHRTRFVGFCHRSLRDARLASHKAEVLLAGADARDLSEPDRAKILAEIDGLVRQFEALVERLTERSGV